MIQPLRSAHRYTFAILMVALPVILIAGLRARNVAGTKKFSTCSVRDVQTIRKTSDAGREYAWVPACQWAEPDVLIYWTGRRQRSPALPEDAEFVGEYRPGKTFVLSPRQQNGSVLLYSLPEQKVVSFTHVEEWP